MMSVGQRQRGGLAGTEPPFQYCERNGGRGPGDELGRCVDGLRSSVLAAPPCDLVCHRHRYPNPLGKALEQLEMTAAGKKNQG